MIDLYLGSDLGLWTLQEISPNQVTQVFTLDKTIAERAKNLGITVYLENANSVSFIASNKAFSIHYPKILKPHLISKYKNIYNLHPGYLPWGRGYYPIFWALWEDSPAGVTLHEINEEIDQGNIIAQIQVYYQESDTGGSLFQKIRQAEKRLFQEYYNRIINDDFLPSFPQNGQGSYHNKKDFIYLKAKTNWQNMKGKDLIKLIRCLTCDGYTGLEIELGKRSFEICLKPLLK